MIETKGAARNAVVAAFDDALRVLRWYTETHPDAEERARLVGVEPDLSDVRYRFERATAPEDES